MIELYGVVLISFWFGLVLGGGIGLCALKERDRIIHYQKEKLRQKTCEVKSYQKKLEG